MHHVVSPCQHIRKCRRERDWSDYCRSRRGIVAIFHFHMHASPPSSSSSSSALQPCRETQSALQPAPEIRHFLSCFWHSIPLDVRLYPFPAPATPFDTRVTEQISCEHLWLHGDFCWVFFPINTHTRIRHTCLSARHTPDSVKRRHYWRGRPCFPRQEKKRRKTVLPLFKQLT